MPVAISTRDKTWSKMFPNSFKTEQQSLVFVKKLFAVAISNIVYIRAIFPEHAFFDKHLEGIKLKILREDSKCPGATKVISWVRGCFDALDKRYLRTVIIGFYTDPDDPDTVIESYSFKFTYANNEVAVSMDSTNPENNCEAVVNGIEPPEKIKKATLSLLRTMIMAGNTQSALPEKVIMTMKLLYYDEITPEDYEPNGFKTSDYAGFRHETETINAKLGQVETDYHSFRLILRTDKDSFTENYSKENRKLPSLDNSKSQDSIAEVNIEQNSANAEEFAVRCPCSGNKDDGIMIMCENCKNWQHSVCFGIEEENLVPDTHICDLCADNNKDLEPTNLILNNLKLHEREELCLMRRAIHHCKSFEMIDPQQLSQVLGVELNVSKGVFHKLQNENILINCKRKNKAKGLFKLINKKILDDVSNRYMNGTTDIQTTENKEMKATKNNDKAEINLNISQESCSQEPIVKRLRACVAKTPVISSKN